MCSSIWLTPMTGSVSFRPPALTQTPNAALSSCGIGSVMTVKPLGSLLILISIEMRSFSQKGGGLPLRRPTQEAASALAKPTNIGRSAPLSSPAEPALRDVVRDPAAQHDSR